MSDIASRIQEDIKQSMKEKNQARLDTLRSVKTAILNLQTSGKDVVVDDDAVIWLVRKALKQREESAAEFNKAGRKESADKELLEASILKEYLPAEMSDSDLTALINKFLEDEKITEKKDFGKAMKELQKIVAGRADNKKISQKLNEVLK
ncbi:MAG: GatB/YqeY domain-containing protein [Candidatus Omnitrophica bacterium]|nr:GatB/YqeY domain-containing protein [Candidatus Omnitrophota bacterium]